VLPLCLVNKVEYIYIYKALVVGVELGGRGAATSKNGQIYQQWSCCNRQNMAPPVFAPANRAPTTTIWHELSWIMTLQLLNVTHVVCSRLKR